MKGIGNFPGGLKRKRTNCSCGRQWVVKRAVKVTHGKSVMFYWCKRCDTLEEK